MSEALLSSRLARDLEGEAHDPLYRAMSYLAAHGGPPITGRPDDVGNLRAQRDGMRAWWQTQPQAAALAQAYTVYCDRWSPHFLD